MSIDFTKPVQTKNGRKVRVLCTDASGAYPVVCLLEDNKRVVTFTINGEGRYFGGPTIDLMNVPEQVTVDVWVNIYDRTSHATKEDALKFAGPGCRATLHIKRTVPVGHVDE